MWVVHMKRQFGIVGEMCQVKVNITGFYSVCLVIQVLRCIDSKRIRAATGAPNIDALL